MLLAMVYRVSWNEAAAQAIGRFALYACLLLAVVLVTPLVMAALTPMIAGCCTAIAGNAGAWAMVPVVFGGAMAVKP